MTDAVTPYAENTGGEFADPDVVAAYVHRTDYPERLYTRLLELSPGRRALVDLGCGPGQLARRLAPRFEQVTAIDPSAAMLRLARGLPGGEAPNIAWVRTKAEDLDLEPPIDLVVAGASIHWMDPLRLFPRLARAMGADGVMAILGGDGPAQAPWVEAWRRVIVDWVGRMGGVWNGQEHRRRIEAHEPWFDVLGRQTFTASVTQSVDELIEAEHSRATWTRAKMGDCAPAFDADLRAVLAPYAREGRVTFGISSALVWGRPRTMPNAP